MTCLLDANVLIALFEGDHVHHQAIRDWYVALGEEFATCPIVEGALMRWIVRLNGSDGVAQAIHELDKLAADTRHRFWPDELPYRNVSWQGVLGHQQITDAYLAALARKHGGRLATLDRGLAALQHDVAELIPTPITDKR